MPHRAIPEIVKNKARAVGAEAWLDDVPRLIAEIEEEWAVSVGPTLTGGTEAFVAEATCADGRRAVLKLMIPRTGDGAANEIAVLRCANGDGCARLLRGDAARSALLVERLGRPLSDLGVPIARRHEILCDLAACMWRPAPGLDLQTGADKGRWLAEFIAQKWEVLDKPCTEKAVEYALDCARRRTAAHDDERAVLVHGDVHQWNALEAGGGFKLIDPDGLLAEAEYDLGILMREDPAELLVGDARDRAMWLAQRSGLDATAIWEWGAAERVSTGLLATEIGLETEGRMMLAVADRIAGP